MMAGGFTEAAFINKLSDLNNSSGSIQTLSLWLIHHRKHHGKVVQIWFRELIKAKDSKKLTFMYLANDVIQNSRKKGPEYGQEFSLILDKAFEHMSKSDTKTKNSLNRLIKIWNERGIYDNKLILEFQRIMASSPEENEPPIKKVKVTVTKERRKFDSEKIVEHSDGSIETHIQLSPHTPAGDPPEPEELIKAIQDLEVNIASSDEVVRERIAKLPREVSEVSLISKIQDKDTAEKLSKQVTEAVQLLSEYNSRLVCEMEHRKRVSVMMTDFLYVQKELLQQAHVTLDEYQAKQSKVMHAMMELQKHIRSLPDLTQLPNVTDGLAPLPSAEHLFMQ
ncbi:regulation of nuclear pre-mRNA domain-containing protein 1B [Diabrotica virgifera virgifera]|uniref:Regulation of nuclear pre-mRNA domain-containing protein 1B n=1 Tax=Diabrotica virgifera virgifera TaxID=50390 RepID=A0A6P7GKY3_DIAVI|nr:regulation of nuclear pre-mRNA domain-containing protein 1B [Diabrotica virgifera virgifera]